MLCVARRGAGHIRRVVQRWGRAHCRPPTDMRTGHRCSAEVLWGPVEDAESVAAPADAGLEWDQGHGQQKVEGLGLGLAAPCPCQELLGCRYSARYRYQYPDHVNFSTNFGGNEMLWKPDVDETTRTSHREDVK